MSWREVLAGSAVEQAKWIRSGELSSHELCSLYLARIDELDRDLNAFTDVFRHRALLNARLKDVSRRRGEELAPFHGVPIGIKDLNFVRGAPTRFGSRAVPHMILPFDDLVVASLRRGGFVVLGKLATSEFGAMPVTEPDIHPPTRNPWNLRHSAGGSSGGSGAAVAARLLPIAQGSDGAGSIRIPSAFCHLFGIKPSRGRVPNAYRLDDRRLLYTCGPLARTVEDAAMMLDVMSGTLIGKHHWAPPPPKPFHQLIREDPRQMRIALAMHSPIVTADPEIADAIRRAARILEGLGHVVEERELPAASVDEFLPLWQFSVCQVPFARWARTQPITRWLAEAGRVFRPEEIIERHAVLESRLLPQLHEVDLWLTPAVALPPPPVGAFISDDPQEAFHRAAQIGAFTAYFNVTGQPAASVPLGLTS